MPNEKQREWPRGRDTGVERNAPRAFFKHPDGYLRSERSLAGPLRLGTEPLVGPKGAAGNGSSDFGMDRISPRGFDPMGTALSRYGPQEESPLISRQLRGGRKRGE